MLFEINYPLSVLAAAAVEPKCDQQSILIEHEPQEGQDLKSLFGNSSVLSHINHLLIVLLKNGSLLRS